MDLILRPFNYLVVTTILLLAACNKPAPITVPPNTHGDSTNTTGGSGTPTDTSSAKIYVLGTTGNDSLVYWYKGVPTLLVRASNVYGRSMVVVDSDVYVAGGIGEIDTTNLASYWKNGTQYTLSLYNGAVGETATGIFVSGTDVYVSGTMHFNDPPTVSFTPRWGFTACYWKNGQPTLLTDWPGIANYFGYAQSVRSDYTTGIYVSGNDVYVAGGERYPINHPLPFHFTGYWKNDVYVDLPNYLTDTAINTQVSEPTTGSIALNGADIYVSGNQLPFGDQLPSGLYWLNGTLDSLSPATGEYIYNVQPFGNDVYAVGNYYLSWTQHAAYWKNGAMTLVDSSIYGTAGYSISVSGNDVYVAGNKGYTGISYPVYWKNGVEKDLGYNGTAYVIVVK